MTIAVLAEKPAVARDIARVLGANRRRDGVLYGEGYVVTWAIGHLVGLAQPHEIRGEWKSWRRDLLPMLPQEWPLVVSESTREQFDLVCRVLRSPKVERVVCATDAGRVVVFCRRGTDSSGHMILCSTLLNFYHWMLLLYQGLNLLNVAMDYLF